MNWNGDKSITLSQLCVGAFGLLLAALDIGAYWLVDFFITLRGMSSLQYTLMMITLYVCSAFGWVTLWELWVLLRNIKDEQIFIQENVTLLRVVSWCCAVVAGICVASAVYYLPFLVAAMAAAFMALIVRIVKNIFQRALAMKDELDFTV